MKNETVFVGLSGGVDSSVSAYLLKEAGYHVVGVFIKVWHPTFLACNWEEERLDAMRVAAHLDIPFLTTDAEDAYKRDVAEYFIREYAAGRTPNPDVLCNTHVKFGHFYDFAMQEGADRIATGHYARTEGGRLLTAVDPAKDQSYFLWNIKKDVLSHTIFPVGGMRKDEVRRIAESVGLPTAAKKDSQGICFLGHVDVREFLSHYVDLQEGALLNEEGEVIGAHFGVELYTVGQRHGFRIDKQETVSGPVYVSAKDIVKNTVTVARVRPQIGAGSAGIAVAHMHWLGSVPAEGDELDCVMRYHGPRTKVRITEFDGGRATLEPRADVDTPAGGQSAVLYRGEECLGGGIID